VPLAPGDNVIEATVQNDWRPAVTDQLTIAYKRPPTVDPVTEVIKVVEKSPITITANAWSPVGVPLVGAQLGGEKGTAEDWKDVELKETDKTKDGWKGWTVTLKNVPVNEGEQWRKTLLLSVSNADGFSRVPATIKLSPPDKPTLAKPIVKMRITDGEIVQQQLYSVPIFVQSDSPLTQVELWRGEERYPLLEQVEKKNGKFEVDTTVRLTLAWEANPLRLVAVNSDGSKGEARATVSLPRPPVRVVVDKIDEMEPNAEVKKTRTPREPPREQVTFDRLERNYAFLHGHIEWSDDKAPQLDEPQLAVVVYVNGSRQFPVALQPRGTGNKRNQRAFGVPMFLPKKDDNKVVIEVPARVKQEDPLRPSFSLDCAKGAEERQRLHVLVIGVNVKDGEQLKRNMLALFGPDVPRGFEGEFKAPAYKEARLVGVLFDNVRKEEVFARLDVIAERIQNLQEQTGWQNDVVMLFMQGNEDQDAQGNRYLRSSLTERLTDPDLKKTAIAYKDLPNMPGIQLTLLNVARRAPLGDAGEKGVRPADPHAGFIYYVWRDGTEITNPAPKTLGYLDDAKKLSKVGPIIDDVTKRVKENPKANAEASSAFLPESFRGFLLTGR
jgi:hypothetical protein